VSIPSFLSETQARYPLVVRNADEAAAAASAQKALVGRLETFAQLLDEKLQFRNLRPTLSRPLTEQVDQLLPGIRHILNSIEPGLCEFKYGGLAGSTAAAQAARIGIGILRDHEAIKTELRASGISDAPSLQLHRRVWDSSRSFWQLGRRAEALAAAWKAVNAHIQERIGRRDLSDTKLVQAAFGIEPKGARLHLPGNRDTDTWRSRQLGALHLAQACVFGSRNPIAHVSEIEIAYAEAVEHLAMLSCLCRWIDETEATHYD
jgi:hypothetical protein